MSWTVSTSAQENDAEDQANLLQGIKLNSLHKTLRVHLEASARKRGAELSPERVLTSDERSQEQLQLLAGILRGDLCEISDLGHETHFKCAIHNDEASAATTAWQ